MKVKWCLCKYKVSLCIYHGLPCCANKGILLIRTTEREDFNICFGGVVLQNHLLSSGLDEGCYSL